ncbi:MAG: hypothetical protein KF901_27740 [Myxococcales bacterium]|nr:hypothetical protein [Myxococcales bacterium]
MRWVLAAALSVACASAPPPPVAPRVPPDDGAAVLASRLPVGATACAVARPTMLSERQRELVRELSSTPFAWAAGAPIVAYADATQTRDGRRATRVLLRVTSVEEARTWLETQAPVRVEWTDEPACRGDDARCWRWTARALDAGTITVSRGPWGERPDRGDREDRGEWHDRGAGAGVEVRCARLARERRDALEITIRTPSGGGFELGAPLDTQIVLERDTVGVRWEELTRLPHDLPFEIFEHLERAAAPHEPGAVLSSAASYERRLTRDGVHARARLRWEDLELAIDDERRVRAALAAEARAHEPVPVHTLPVERRELLDAQVGLRLTRLRQATPAEADVQAEALRTLLERALDFYPGDAALAQHLTTALLHLGDGRAAADLAEEVLAAGPPDPDAWRVRRRQALALVGAPALASALREDGLLRAREADAAARVLTAFDRRYEVAEAAWIAAHQMEGAVPRGARVAPMVEVPMVSLLETTLALLDMEGLARSLHVILRVDAPLPAGVSGPAEVPVVSWREGDRGVRVAASTTASQDHHRGLWREMLRGLPDEAEAELLVVLLPFGGSPGAPDGAARLRGRLSGGALRLSAARFVPALEVRWERVAELVAEPLAGLESRLFPPPDLDARFPSAEDATEAVRRAEDEPTLRCEARGVEVRCQASPELDASQRAWRRVVEPWIVRGRARRL